jgi:hypothetical protein
MILLVPRYGVLGAAAAYMLSDWLAGLIPVILVTRWLTGQRMQWLRAEGASLEFPDDGIHLVGAHW